MNGVLPPLTDHEGHEMLTLSLIGIGTGNPEHLTLAAIREINAADLILIPRKGKAKADLAILRETLCRDVLTNPKTRIVSFDMPVRDAADPDYLRGVEGWHDAIAAVWTRAIAEHLPEGGRVALLVWGDPALYDSTLRIAARLLPPERIRSIPGIMSINALTAAHTIAMNEIGAAFMVTTGRHLREKGWPDGVDTLVILLDGECSFTHIDPVGVQIYWGAYVGMPEQILRAGALSDMADEIIHTRAKARKQHGWIMDIYLLRQTIMPHGGKAAP
ncbi:MAG: precorrin-6A synthase (deacetylating) [Acetobacter papayae]